MFPLLVECQYRTRQATDCTCSSKFRLFYLNTSTRPVTVSKPTPYTFDLGNLLANDPNPLPSKPDEATLQATARDAAQALLSQLLSICEVKSTSDGVLL